MTEYWAKTKLKRPLNKNAKAKLDNGKSFHFAIVNDGGRYLFYLDGIQVEAKNTQDFTLEGWHYKPIRRSKLSLIWQILRSR